MTTEKRLFEDNSKFIKEDFNKRLIRLDHALRVITPEGETKLPHDQLVILLTARKKLKNLPTVDAVEVVHGQWLYDSGRECYFCSACNKEALHTSHDDPVYDYDWEENLRYSYTDTIVEEHLTNYCPNCGAKMDGDGNG